jgi:hypothetical protein
MRRDPFSGAASLKKAKMGRKWDVWEGEPRSLRKGQQVSVRCDIAPGPFSHERLITVQSCSGPVSGFVRVQCLDEQPGSKTGFIHGVIVSVARDHVVVRLPGSFFTTNGVTSVTERQLKQAA